LYYLLRIVVWLGLKIFCRSIWVNQPEIFKTKGPLVLACNHPNAFLDAIILGSLFHQPVHFLARGDAFRNPVVRRILRSLQLIPVYRLSEGRENLSLNETSFARCQQILASGGIVLIFAEGLCINQWVLRPVKKGVARIALTAINDTGISTEVKVIPVSLNYNSFSSPGKTLIIHFGDMISKKDLTPDKSEAEKMHFFNGLLSGRLADGMLQSGTHQQIIQTLLSNHQQHGIRCLKSMQNRLVSAHDPILFQKLKMPGSLANGRAAFYRNLAKTAILLIPAAAGWLLHAPLYLPVKAIVRQKTRGSVFYDSMLFCVLTATYPFYWLLLNILLLTVNSKEWINFLFLFMPLFAWISVYWKEGFLKARNYLALTEKERRFINYRLPGSNSTAAPLHEESLPGTSVTR
jgi:1-acyl-sn-glycerol-3-phosphate acyltransferase